jgi:hypothetical protein
MYCPSCGAESALELNYCNRCGANMASSLVPSQQIVPVSLTKPAVAIGLTTTLITLGGFGVLVEGAIKLAQVFHDPDPIMAIIMLGMATIMVSDIMLIRLLSRIIRASLDTKPIAQLPKLAVKEVPKQLSPRLEPVPSVTEHTTRTFTPAFKEPSDRGTK